MSGNSGSYLFSYNSKNTLNRMMFDSTRRRREGFENTVASPVQEKSGLTPKNSLLARRTPLQRRSFQGNDIDDPQDREIQFRYMFILILWRHIKVTSSPMPYKTSPDDAYMRQNESILVSPRLPGRIHFADQAPASPTTEAFRMASIYPLFHFSAFQTHIVELRR